MQTQKKGGIKSLIQVEFNDKKYLLVFNRYNNNNIAMFLTNKNEKFAITVDMMRLEDNSVILYNFSELQGIEEALIKAKVIKFKPKSVFVSGFWNYRIFDLTGRALKELKIQEKILKNQIA